MTKSWFCASTCAWGGAFALFAAACTVNTNAETANFDLDGSIPTGTSTGGGMDASSGGGSDGGDMAGTDGGTLPPIEGGVPPGAAIGAACTTDDSGAMCRAGLSCGTSGQCQASHASAVGTACVVADECASGLYCAYGRCAQRMIGALADGGTADDSGATAASGAKGTSCKSDVDCADGLRCALQGFSAVCAAQGPADVGSKCSSSLDCLAGLICTHSLCTPPPAIPGASLGVPTWAGESCATETTDTGTARAWFHVPRGQNDGDFYRLPFPNDIRRDSAGHPNLQGHPTPGKELLGVDIVDEYLRAIEQENDGFGTYQTVFFRFVGEVDYDSLKKDGVIQYLDLTPGDPAFGQGRGYVWNATSAGGKYICPNSMSVRMGNGDPLTPGHTYGVIITNGATSTGHSPIVQGEDLGALLAPTAPADAALTTAYAAYKPLRDYLAAKLIDPGTIVNAAVFTVGHVQRAAQVLAASVAQLPVPPTSGWMKCGSGGTDPCSDVSGTRACPAAADPAFDELHAVIDLPIFQSGTEPYQDPKDDGQIAITGDTIAPVRTEHVCLALTVPKGTMPANGWPLVIYAHGTGGSYRSHITEGDSATLAGAKTADGTAAPFAVLGIDQVEHGPRRGASTDTPDHLFYNFANPHAARDNAMQGAIDQLSLARFAATFSVGADASPTGAAIKFDPAGLLFWGHSQGATEGGISMPFSPDVKGVLFSGQGASLIDALLGKHSPVDIAAALPYALEDIELSNGAPSLAGGSYHPVLSLLQAYLDRSDPLNYAAAIAASPPTGATGHHVFQVYGQKDTYAPPATEATYAAAAHLGVAPHDSSAAMPDNLGTESTTGVSANLNGGKLTGAVRQYAPGAYDGHFVVFDNPAAKADATSFLAQIALGRIPKVGP